MSRIEIFFASGHKVKLDERTPFVRGYRPVYDFAGGGDEGAEPDMSDVLSRTGALVNWDHVAWVRRVKDEDEEED